MDNEIFKKETFTYEDILKAVKYGVNYEVDEIEEVWSIPEGNVQEWLSTTKLRTAEEWQNLYPDIKIIEESGWKKEKGWKKLWFEELITYQQYIQRRDESTCMYENKEDEKE